MSSPEKDKKDTPAPPPPPAEESRIVIRPDGEVVIENLSERLSEVAIELDPDADLACPIEPSADDAK